MLVIALQSGKKADGGLESLTQLVCRFRRTQVTLLTQLESAKTDRWRGAGHDVWVHPLPYRPGERPAGGPIRSRLRTLWTHLHWNVSIAWKVLERKIDVVHVNDPHALWHCGPALWLLRTPVLFNIRDTKPRVSSFDRWKWRLAFSLSSRQVVLSREMGGFWAQVVAPWIRGAVQPIYSVVDGGRLSDGQRRRAALRAEAGLSEADFCVGYVASFSPKKAQLEFITRTAHELKSAPDRLRLVFIGDFEPAEDPYARACAEAVQQTGLEDRVRFLGYRADVHDWYGALDLVLVATRNEGLARCMIEALAAGTPVLSFSVCSAREILESTTQTCGLVVNQGDYPALTKALFEVVSQQRKLHLWSGNAKLRAASLFRPDRNTVKYEEAYEELAL